MEELEVDFRWVKRKTVRAIASYCKLLKVFKTNFVDCRTSLEPIWLAVDNTLVEYCGDVHKNELARIARHCTRLEKLGLVSIQELVLEHRKEVLDLLQALKCFEF